MARIVRCDRCLTEVPRARQCRMEITDTNCQQLLVADLCLTCVSEIRAQIEVPSPAKP